jgi:hypothetical protein
MTLTRSLAQLQKEHVVLELELRRSQELQRGRAGRNRREFRCDGGL